MSSTTTASKATRQRAAGDILMQVVVRVANLALGVVVTAIVVRTLGQAGYGQWSTLLAALTLIAFFSNFGMEGAAMREAARDPGSEHEWVGTVLLLRLLLLGPVMVASFLAILLLEESHEMLIAGLILMVAMPFGGAGALRLLFQLRVDNRVPMLVLTLRSVLWGGAVVIIAATGGGLVQLAIAMAATNSIGSIVQLIAAAKLDTPLPRPTRKHLRQLVRVGLPIGIAGVLVIAYARIDQLIVYGFAGAAEAGLYASVYNIVDQSHFVPIAIMTTLAPVLAASWPADRPRLLRAARQTNELLAVASFGGLAFAIAAAEPFVELIFGAEFASAAQALPVLGGAFVLICFGYLNGNLLLVLGLQPRFLRISLVGLIVNLAGNFALVPAVGYMGAAWMTLVTEAVVFAQTSVLVMRKLEVRRLRLGRIGRTAAAATALGLLVGGLRIGGAPAGVLIAAACLAYPSLLFAFRALGPDDVRTVLRRGATA